MTPKHKHDCAHCRYLGTTGNSPNRSVDHYACHATGIKRVTLIQRDGSDGPEYDSHPLHEGLYGAEADRLEREHMGWRDTLRMARANHHGFLQGLGYALARELEMRGAGS